MTVVPLYCGFFVPSNRASEEDSAASHQEEVPHWLYCRTCGQAIAVEDARIAVQGAHQHVFFNPAGLVFEIGCFQSAPGCAYHGEPTPEFSWFPGYAWSVALCSQCAAHLGWGYERDTHGFVGLILAQLVAR